MPMRNTGADYPITPFESGQPLSSQLTADRLNGGLDATAQNTVRWGRGLHGSRGPGGTTINRLRPRGVTTSSTPFQVIKRANPESPGTFQASIYWDSSILKSIIPDDTLTIVGLANAPTPIGDGDRNWFTLIPEDFIWVDVAVDNFGVPTGSAHVGSYGLGSTPTFEPGSPPGDGTGAGTYGPVIYTIGMDVFLNTYYTQTHIRIPVALTHAGEGGPVLRQLLKSNLRLNGGLYNGPKKDTNGTGNIIVGIVELVPWIAPYL